MFWFDIFLRDHIIFFTRVLTRVTGLVMIAPVLSQKSAPVNYRALLCFAMAVVLTPPQWEMRTGVPAPENVTEYAIMLIPELFIGIIIGMGLVIFFSGIQMGGALIGRLCGMMLANVVDPATGVSMPTYSRFLHLLLITIFVCMGGVRMTMEAFLDTFKIIPVGQAPLPDEKAAAAIFELVAGSFYLGMQVSMPIVVSLMLALLVLALVGRAVPQLNIMVVGFGIKSMLSFVLTSIMITGMMYAYTKEIDGAFETIMAAFK